MIWYFILSVLHTIAYFVSRKTPSPLNLWMSSLN